LSVVYFSCCLKKHRQNITSEVADILACDLWFNV
jgi:transcription initiation factor TFIID subunit TAF12